MKFKKCLLPVAMLASFTLAGCQSNADDHAADVYQTDQLNTKQDDLDPPFPDSFCILS
ncbi:TPA: hypothetical protein RKT78_000314 [Escherichia coli]|nr:hypothetical protein [Escherichia coli]